MNILHLAVENFAGIPMRLVQEERRRGHYSRLITLLSPHQRYEEDIALNLPFSNAGYLPAVRKLLRGNRYEEKSNIRREQPAVKYWSPANVAEKALFALRDALWLPRANAVLKEIGGIEAFDVIIADGGHDFTRFPKILPATKIPIVTFYYGSDLRTRGIIREVQNKSRATFTFEHDHTLLLPQAEFLFYPYIPPEYSPEFRYAAPQQNENIIIGHAPTHRAAKGTEQILETLRNLQREFPVEILLVEKMPHSEALAKKSQCHLFIDQIGELGYGLNSVESAWMGIPTCVELLPDFEKFLNGKCGGNAPLLNVRRNSLEEDLRKILADRESWERYGNESAAWARKVHSVGSVADAYLGTVLGLAE
jgi:hypothetical protein